jgi:hypothetical protein
MHMQNLIYPGLVSKAEIYYIPITLEIGLFERTYQGLLLFSGSVTCPLHRLLGPFWRVPVSVPWVN